MSQISKEQILKRAKLALDRSIEKARNQRNDEDRKFLVSKIGEDLAVILMPLLEEIAQQAKFNKQDLADIVASITAEMAKVRFENPEINIPAIELPEIHIPNIEVPEINIPEINVPEAKVSVNIPPIKVPDIKIPDMKWPEGNMPIEGWVYLMGVDTQNPLPVQLRDVNGKPVSLDFENLNVFGGGGGSRNPLKSLTDIELRATHLDVQQLSGSVNSVNVQQIAGNTAVAGSGYQDNALRVVHATDAIASVEVKGSVESTVATGTTLHDAADDGDAPLKIGGIAMTANPTAVSGGDRASARTDDIGRLLTRPLQVRDLIATAYATLTNGTETVLLAGASSVFHDLVYVMCANQSDAAAFVDFRAGTGGAVVLTVEVPASGTAGVALPLPIPAPEVNMPWTADMSDISGTTIDISALFIKEV